MKQLRGTPLKRFLRKLPPPPSTVDLVVVCQSVAYPVNVGSIFRIADALDVTEVVLSGITPTPPHPTISKVGRGKDRRVPWRYVEQPEAALAALKEAGYWLGALEITERCDPYYDVDYPHRIALVLGNEDHGVTRACLALCDTALFVPMYGKGKSLNVHVSLAVVGYHILHRLQP
ncbi:MAG: TrmH family RNA methyltransferase [Anaerolineae bacterium]|mgnify:CR=1 FL=1|jgi:tRNA (guanosine-2'-O-)-methyltransferase